jgi:hypothetical protein
MPANQRGHNRDRRRDTPCSMRATPAPDGLANNIVETDTVIMQPPPA